jgi:hypothetical protein
MAVCRSSRRFFDNVKSQDKVVSNFVCDSPSLVAMYVPFLSGVPRKVMVSQGLVVEGGGNGVGRTGEKWMMLKD